MRIRVLTLTKNKEKIMYTERIIQRIIKWGISKRGNRVDLFNKRRKCGVQLENLKIRVIETDWMPVEVWKV